MKNTSSFLLCLFMLVACNTSKKAAPIENNTFETQTFIIDSFNAPSPSIIYEGVGINLEEQDLSLSSLDQLLYHTEAAWIQIKPRDGLKTIFQPNGDTLEAKKGFDFVALKDLLQTHDAKLALVIDPIYDQIPEIVDVAQQIKDWKIPFAHWQLAEKPYLQLLDTLAPFWISGSDFAKKMQIFSNAIKKTDPNQEVIYGAGNTNRNLFTDEILNTESEYFAWSGLALYNFYSIQTKKSEYFQKKSQSEKSFLIHLMTPEKMETGLDFAVLFENLLAIKSRQPAFKADIQINNVDLEDSQPFRVLKALNQLLKKGTQVQSRYTPLNSTKESTIQSITVFTDTTGNKTIAFSNPFNQNLTVDLGNEYDNQSVYTTNYTLSDSVKSKTLSSKIAVRPYSFTIVSANQKNTSLSKSLTITSLSNLDQQNLVIKWAKQEKYAKYVLNFGLNKNDLSQKIETISDSLYFDKVRNGRTYFFDLQGIDSLGNILASKTFEFKAIPPDIPRIAKIRRDLDKLIIHWTPLPDATNYTVKVYRNGFIEELEVGQQNFLILDNIPGNESYRFAVKAQNVYGESEFSPISKASQKGILPPAPTHFRKEGNLFMWNNSSNLTNEGIQYQLYKGPHPNRLQEIGESISDTTFFYFEPVTENTYFAVKAKNSFGESQSYSNIVSLISPIVKTSQIFDVYPSGDSTNIIIKYVAEVNRKPAKRTILVLQDRSKTNWVEERIDCSPFINPDLEQYRLRLPTNQITDKELYLIEE